MQDIIWERGSHFSATLRIVDVVDVDAVTRLELRNAAGSR